MTVQATAQVIAIATHQAIHQVIVVAVVVLVLLILLVINAYVDVTKIVIVFRSPAHVTLMQIAMGHVLT